MDLPPFLNIFQSDYNQLNASKNKDTEGNFMVFVSVEETLLNLKPGESKNVYTFKEP